jgi:hypothetical protein
MAQDNALFGGRHNKERTPLRVHMTRRPYERHFEPADLFLRRHTGRERAVSVDADLSVNMFNA